MKKYLKFDVLGAIAFGIGVVVASIGLVYYGFNPLDDADPRWLSTAMTIVGFAGCILFPVAWVDAFRGLSEEDE